MQTNTIQLVDSLLEMDYTKIREAIPPVKIVQVIHVLNEKQIDEALEIEPWVDAILLDSGNPNLQVKILGGTGNSHDWKLSRKIREAVKKPVFGRWHKCTQCETSHRRSKSLRHRFMQ